MVKKKPLRLDCKSCVSKRCCAKMKGVFLRKEEAFWLMLKYPSVDITVEEDHYGEKRSFLNFPNNRCPFLTDRLTCFIYDNRPRVCYWYPCDFRELTHGKMYVNENCEWVHKHYDKIKELFEPLEAPEDPLKEPDRRLFRLKISAICEIFGYSHDIPRGNKHAKELIKIW